MEHQASDLHLKPMRPPLVRINGKLEPVGIEILDPATIVDMLDAGRLHQEQLGQGIDFLLGGVENESADALAQFRPPGLTRAHNRDAQVL